MIIIHLVQEDTSQLSIVQLLIHSHFIPSSIVCERATWKWDSSSRTNASMSSRYPVSITWKENGCDYHFQRLKLANEFDMHHSSLLETKIFFHNEENIWRITFTQISQKLYRIINHTKCFETKNYLKNFFKVSVSMKPMRFHNVVCSLWNIYDVL